MSVYTAIPWRELQQLLRDYRVGTLINYQGIRDGIENTNYFVTTSEQELVLTLFETQSHEQLDYFIRLMSHLAQRSRPVAQPIADTAGHYLQTIQGKPAALVQRLPGQWVTSPTIEQCRSLGTELAHFHATAATFPLRRDNDRDLPWIELSLSQLRPHLNRDELTLLQQEVAYQKSIDIGQLPHGVIHADLFRDNALFKGDRVSGIVDLYNASHGPWLYDLAVITNDWCLTQGRFAADLRSALLEGYQLIRPLNEAELGLWMPVLRRAALRFWVSRMVAFYYPRRGKITHTRDPEEYRQILEHYRREVQPPFATGVIARPSRIALG